MSNMLIGAIDALGAVFFLLAVRWSVHNLRNESALSEFWTAYTVAMVMGVLFATVKAVEWFGLSTRIANLVQPFFAIILGTVLLLTAIVCVVSPIERAVK